MLFVWRDCHAQIVYLSVLTVLPVGGRSSLQHFLIWWLCHISSYKVQIEPYEILKYATDSRVSLIPMHACRPISYHSVFSMLQQTLALPPGSGPPKFLNNAADINLALRASQHSPTLQQATLKNWECAWGHSKLTPHPIALSQPIEGTLLSNCLSIHSISRSNAHYTWLLWIYGIWYVFLVEFLSSRRERMLM